MSEQEERANRLSELLVQRGIVAAAQMELAMADREINELPLEEVLLARGWVREDVLYEAAPWLKSPGSKAGAKPAAGASTKTAAAGKTASTAGGQRQSEKPGNKAEIKAPPPGPVGANSSPLSDNYQDNLKKYRDLLKNITEQDFAD